VKTIEPAPISHESPPRRRALPARVSLLGLDFDGVLTDNRVWIAENGVESVVCSREDSLGLQMLRECGVAVVVLTQETNAVVSARCRKLGIPCWQGTDDKATLLNRLAQDRGIRMSEVVFLGNDVNDLECMRAAGCGVAVSDAHPDVLEAADLVLGKPGGRGAVRELCDRIVSRMRSGDPQVDCGKPWRD
jgi:YrbI family 3-deoxy-D-manno-octulosonate 8-phosphate phosphatase